MHCVAVKEAKSLFKLPLGYTVDYGFTMLVAWWSIASTVIFTKRLLIMNLILESSVISSFSN